MSSSPSVKYRHAKAEQIVIKKYANAVHGDFKHDLSMKHMRSSRDGESQRPDALGKAFMFTFFLQHFRIRMDIGVSKCLGISLLCRQSFDCNQYIGQVTP